MTQNVSVPEKTLEHWASLCVAYRYRSLAAQWWPVNGVDIDIQALPAQPGKAIQLELKTITPAGPGCHKVNVDLGQLWEYSQKPLARQPFYAFPRPHWDGELAAAAKADGQDATELAVQRSKTGWWFGDWMVVMTTQQQSNFAIMPNRYAFGLRHKSVPAATAAGRSFQPHPAPFIRSSAVASIEVLCCRITHCG